MGLRVLVLLVRAFVCHVFLFITIETSFFLLEAVLVLFCVSAIDFSEYWKVNVHWIIGSQICIVVGASISISAVVTMSMVPMMSQMLLFDLSWGSPFVTLATSSHHGFVLCHLCKFGFGCIYPSIEGYRGLIASEDC